MPFPAIFDWPGQVHYGSGGCSAARDLCHRDIGPSNTEPVHVVKNGGGRRRRKEVYVYQ
jgi:hypothetical protein